MLYYQATMEQFDPETEWTLIEGELVTQLERKAHYPSLGAKYFRVVSVSKAYISFGVRKPVSDANIIVYDRERVENEILKHLKSIDKLRSFYTSDPYLSMCLHEDGAISANNTRWELPKEEQIAFIYYPETGEVLSLDE